MMYETGPETIEEVKVQILDDNSKEKEVDIHQVHIPIHLKFEDLCVKAGEKEILQNVTGEFLPGELVAIMGPSGAGKSTLLNFLAGRSKGMELTGGDITINNQKPTKTMRRKIGYVLQEDVFFSHLTVNQTLKFVGEIRLSDSLSSEQKSKIVDEVMDELGLRKCADTVMGGGIFVTGCSGGEKKRCSIATELITNPSLLMMDEPTSGLDSSTAFNLIQTLKNLAKTENRTIVTTIHQPSSHVFHMFDKLILISGGKVAYCGKTSEVLDFFEHLGSPCYPNWNPADFIMEMLTGESELTQTIADKFIEYKKQKKEKEESTSNGHTNGHVNGQANGGSSKTSPKRLSMKKKKISVFSNGFFSNENEDDNDVKLSKWPTGFRTQCKALCQRAFIQSKKEMLDKLGFIQTLGLALVVSLLWFNTPYDEESLVDRQGAIFFVLVYTVLHPIFYNVMTFPTERDVIQKERAAGMYRLSSYYFAKLISEIPALLLQPVILHIITYWASGLNRSPYYFISLLTIATGAFLAQTIGLLIGTVIKQFKRALTVTALVALGSMLLGGFYTKRVPEWMYWARYVSMISYSFNILVRVEFEHASTTFKCAAESAFDICKNNNTTVLTGKDILPHITTIDIGIAESFGVLVLMILATRLTFYYVLKYLNKPT